MAKADTSVKWFHSAMQDAPVCSGTAGALIQILDACLINGFSVRTPDSVVVSGGVATVSISAGNPYDKHAVIEVAGASDPTLNAQWRVASASGSSFTFDCPGVADGTITGATIKRAGAGWGKPFSGTNLAVYQSLASDSTQLYLRVDDTDARFTRVRGYETMSDVSTGVGPFPTLVQHTETFWNWIKSDVINATARDWVVVADNRFMWVLIKASGSSLYGRIPHYFGDPIPFDPLDKYCCVITASNSTQPTGANHPCAQVAAMSNDYGRYYARNYEGTSGPIKHVAFSVLSAVWSGEINAASAIPGSIRVAGPVFLAAGTATNTGFRAKLPGVLPTLEKPEFADLSVHEKDDKAILAVAIVGRGGLDNRAVSLFDISGPWR